VRRKLPVGVRLVAPIETKSWSRAGRALSLRRALAAFIAAYLVGHDEPGRLKMQDWNLVDPFNFAEIFCVRKLDVLGYRVALFAWS